MIRQPWARRENGLYRVFFIQYGNSGSYAVCEIDDRAPYRGLILMLVTLKDYDDNDDTKIEARLFVQVIIGKWSSRL